MLKRRALIIGCNGQLGQDMVKALDRAGYHTDALDFPQIDITNLDTIHALCKEKAPEFIINCAAYTAVDKCETEQKAAFAVNTTGCLNIAKAAQSIDATVIHFSTDYVFDGLKTTPYVEEDDTNPQTIYGKSKRDGEVALLSNCSRSIILRIAWLYGKHGTNFVKTIYEIGKTRLREGKPLRVVNDQWGTPTCTIDVCRQTLALMMREETGIFHCTCEGACTWFDFAKTILASGGIATQVEPCTTEEFPRPARRPPYSVLENSRLKAIDCNIMPDWKQAFQEFMISWNPH